MRFRSVITVAERHTPGIRIVTPQQGVKWFYSPQADSGKMTYDDWRERYQPEKSWEYRELAEEAARERGEDKPSNGGTDGGFPTVSEPTTS